MMKLLIQGLLAILILSSCAKKSRNNGGGTLDGGGGDFIFATREEVIKTVEGAWEILTRLGPDNPFVIAFNYVAVDSYMKEPFEIGHDPNSPEGQQETAVRQIVTKILRPPSEKPNVYTSAAKDPKFVDLPNIKILRTKKISFKEKGPCRAPGHKATAASVSKLNFDGELCVSIEYLQKSASTSMKYDVVTLLAHEIAHMHGYGEDDAMNLQLYFKKNIVRLLRMGGLHTKYKYTYMLVRVWQWCQNLLQLYDNLDRADVSVKGAESVLEDMIYMFPRPGEDDIGLARPELEKKAYEALTKTASLITNYRLPLAAPVDEKNLAQIREIFLSLTQLNEVLVEYTVPMETKSARDVVALIAATRRAKVLQYTDPLTLYDPSKRFSVMDVDPWGIKAIEAKWRQENKQVPSDQDDSSWGI